MPLVTVTTVVDLRITPHKCPVCEAPTPPPTDDELQEIARGVIAEHLRNERYGWPYIDRKMPERVYIEANSVTMTERGYLPDGWMHDEMANGVICPDCLKAKDALFASRAPK